MPGKMIVGVLAARADTQNDKLSSNIDKVIT